MNPDGCRGRHGPCEGVLWGNPPRATTDKFNTVINKKGKVCLASLTRWCNVACAKRRCSCGGNAGGSRWNGTRHTCS